MDYELNNWTIIIWILKLARDEIMAAVAGKTTVDTHISN